MPENMWYTLARKILKAGGPPVPVNEHLIELLKTLINEDQVKFLLHFRKPLNFEQIQEKTGIDEIILNEILETLMNVGLLTGIPSRSTGIIVYRLVAFLPGLLEFTLMKGESGPKQKKIARIWEQIFEDATEMTQNNYDIVVNAFKNAPAIDRVIPIGEKLEISEDRVIPNGEIEKVLDKFEVFSVSHCYCRHRKNLLEDPCKVNAPIENCLSFGRTARFAIDHGFAKEITRNESLKILKEAEDLGLVHKAFHVNGDPNLEELAICNCCQCCCGSFGNFYRGAAPTSTLSSHIALIDEQSCIACGTCQEVCPMSAPTLEGDYYIIDIEKCLGCGVCIQKCPEQAIKLQKTELRRVFIPPKKISIHLQ